MGNLTRLLQHRFRAACPAGWVCTAEEALLSASMARTLGFAPRADVLLARKDGARRLWIEFEVSRADPVANHAKFAAGHLFEPQPATDVFVSMVSSHVVRGRSNLAASAVYLMRAIGMSAFQTVLLPRLGPDAILTLNQKPLEVLLSGTDVDAGPEIDRALSISENVAIGEDNPRIHFAANLFEVMLNARAWNAGVETIDGGRHWGQRTVTFFVYDSQTGDFAPSKFCAFMPVRFGAVTMPSDLAMDLATYASLDETQTRFDGSLAWRHLVHRLGMEAVPIAQAGPEIVERFQAWYRRFKARISLHPRGPILLLPGEQGKQRPF